PASRRIRIFFSSRRRHTRFSRDWSSDVCSSDLAARMAVAKKLGADQVIDVQKENPLERIMQITGGRGVDVALDCTAGAGTIPILLGIESLKRKGGTIVVQGEMKEFPNFPLEKFTVKFITMK